MLIATGLTTDTSSLTQSTTGALASDHALPGFNAQGLTVALFGVAGALFVFAVINMLSRMMPVKVHKR